jgi:hypothetical protein
VAAQASPALAAAAGITGAEVITDPAAADPVTGPEPSAGEPPAVR